MAQVEMAIIPHNSGNQTEIGSSPTYSVEVREFPGYTIPLSKPSRKYSEKCFRLILIRQIFVRKSFILGSLLMLGREKCTEWIG